MNIFSNRNNVIAYTVNKDLTSDLYISVQNGEVVINAPWYTTTNQIQKIVEEKKQWILNKIKEYEQYCEEIKSFTEMQEVKVLGKKYDLLIKYKNIETADLSFNKNRIEVIIPNKYRNIENSKIMELLMEKMYTKIAEKEIERAMEKTRILLNIAPEDYNIEKMDKVIAKCEDKIITFNPYIAMYSKETIDYIVLHEFCHLKYKNHTKSFYNMIKTYMPNYEKMSKELNGMAY